MIIMKIKYDMDADITIIEVSDESVDYAEEAENIITHFSKDGKPLILEILDFKDFLDELNKAFEVAK